MRTIATPLGGAPLDSAKMVSDWRIALTGESAGAISFRVRIELYG